MTPGSCSQAGTAVLKCVPRCGRNAPRRIVEVAHVRPASWPPIDASADPDIDDPDEFYDHQLVGLSVVTVDGTVLGAVSDVVHLPTSVLLSVARPEGREVLVPFVASIVPEVDVPGGRVVVDLPPGFG